MTERRKGIGGRRFTVKEPVQFSPAPKTICTICKTNEVEDYPMMRGVCYDCYRGVVTENVEVATIDPRTAAQKDIDQWQEEWVQTLESTRPAL